MNHKTIRIAIALGLLMGLLCCAESTSSLRTPSAMALAQRQQEAATFEGLAHSNSGEIAAAARALAPSTP